MSAPIVDHIVDDVLDREKLRDRVAPQKTRWPFVTMLWNGMQVELPTVSSEACRVAKAFCEWPILIVWVRTLILLS